MPTIKTYYLDDTKNINIETFRTNGLKKHFGVPGNGLVSVINQSKIPSLSFFYEGSTASETLPYLSKLFLYSIEFSYPKLFEIDKFTLKINHHPMSNFMHYTTQTKSIFVHSIVTRKVDKSLVVAHSNIPVKEFALSVLNEFKHRLDGI